MDNQTLVESKYFQSEENSPISNGVLRAQKLEDLQPPPQPDLVVSNHSFSCGDVTVSSALEIEIQMLEPIWFEALSRENKGANDEQIKTLIKLKLEQARELIPSRWMAEKRFKANCQILEQIHDRLVQVLATLQAKEIDDPSVRIEDYQAQRVISDWTKTRQPEFEAIYQETTRVWYKPDTDPITTIFMSMVNKFCNLIATYEYESSIRPPLGGCSKSAPKSVEECATLMDQFDVTNRIDTFDGDLKQPDACAKFSQWKCQWASLVQEMESLPGFNKLMLFEKLKQTLSKLALKLVSRYPPTSQDSYDAAMKELSIRYEDRMAVAVFYIKRGLIRRNTPFVHLEVVKECFNGLQSVRDLFETEGVDMYHFALTCTFLKSLPKDLENNWDDNKIQMKKNYQLKCETAKESGKTPPEWKCGMVENYEQFNAWLRLLSAQLKQLTPKVDRPMKRLHIVAFNHAKHQSASKKVASKKEEGCFICGPSSPSHETSQCEKGLSMTFKQWKDMCLRKYACFKCGSPSHEAHQCDVKCRVCVGKREDNGHIAVMCPQNMSRTTPLAKETKPLKPYFKKVSKKYKKIMNSSERKNIRPSIFHGIYLNQVFDE